MDCPQRQYKQFEVYKQAMNSQPHIVVIEFGTNDILNDKYDENLFITDYLSLINGFKNLASKPTIYINIPNPYYLNISESYNKNNPKYKSVLTAFNKANIQLPIVIKKIALLTNSIIIDLFNLLGGINLLKPDTMHPDLLHPRDLGYNSIAHEIAFNIAKHENFEFINHKHEHNSDFRSRKRDKLIR